MTAHAGEWLSDTLCAQKYVCTEGSVRRRICNRPRRANTTEGVNMDVITARALLGVSPSATAGTIKRAFRRLAGTSHPDRGGDAGSFGRLVEAQRLALDAAPTDEWAHRGPTADRRWLGIAPLVRPTVSLIDSPGTCRRRGSATPKSSRSADSGRSPSVSFGSVLAEKLAAA